MKTTLVCLTPTQAALAKNRPVLTPELMAASGARYSRSQDGLQKILKKIDPANPDKAVDGIFKMIDFGHASIADMAPVAIFMDKVSLWLVYYVWSLVGQGGGQETSTRYVQVGVGGVLNDNYLPSSLRRQHASHVKWAFAAYQRALKFWDEYGLEHPELLRIPRETLEEGLKTPDSKVGKMVARMQRNFAFDRARVFLPASALTNMMLVAPARAWVEILQALLSHPLPEARALGSKCRAELGLVTPRLLRHAVEVADVRNQIFNDYAEDSRMATEILAGGSLDSMDSLFRHEYDGPQCQIFSECSDQLLADGLQYHGNRYSPFSRDVKEAAIRFGWERMAFAEIRDLNRHRTGTKVCPMVPLGFHFPFEELCEGDGLRGAGFNDAKKGLAVARSQAQMMQDGLYESVYFSLLGTEYGFRHTTTLDKAIYEFELRTGIGAHYRYASHIRSAVKVLSEKWPLLTDEIRLGLAEPE